MIHEVDEGLRLLLTEGGPAGGGVELVFDAPTRDWSARRNAPTISVFLHDIREDTARRHTGGTEEHDAAGAVVARREPPRWFLLTYLVTAWTNRPQDEHRLLSEVLRRLVRSDVLPRELLTGSLAELGLPVGLAVAAPGAEGPSPSDIWSALGGELKAAVKLRVLAPLAGERAAVGPPVTEGLVVRAAQGGPGNARVPAPGRRLRYEGAVDPGADGFTARRDRPLPPGRRRRGGAAL
ncbi:hypothetical protein GCM10018793_30830 [Streptomyces sulfonofaciens]|uniref:Pvc16 N-terminal domain-containing protein n=1 Tax=Streptomyces sulfonofaciens TaxID=68272 RepID=A0A919L046_9ACTN|nr:DUF4255 domain-containing protein [Streptomyces sulfonofaciens]GHH79063.1 hypothetical protein GCM10018793_30830 [Streptomyces sulfonofaciens]